MEVEAVVEVCRVLAVVEKVMFAVLYLQGQQYSVLCHQVKNREQMPEMHVREQMYLKLPSFGCR